MKQENFFTEVGKYLALRDELKEKLEKVPHDWKRYQATFNSTLDLISQDILELDLNVRNLPETYVYRLKRIFENRYRPYFLCGEFIRWSYEKPFGYAGDFKIIDDIYCNVPRTQGFERLWDNYFQQLTASEATRERKNDFRDFILELIQKKAGQEVRIMNLACGPAREIKEIFDRDEVGTANVCFDCYDYDEKALAYAAKLLGGYRGVSFYQKNAIRLALRKKVASEFDVRYDLIYSTGLFDYLDHKIASRLITNLKSLLRPGGVIMIANASDKHNNPSVAWMEWVAEWHLIYRSDEGLKQIFIDAGFPPEQIKTTLPSTEVMRYCCAQT